jgi:hypothetical protein
VRERTPTTSDSGEVHPGLPAYLSAMAGHCPYLGPSMAHGLTTWCGYDAGPDDGPHLLAVLVRAAEQVRVMRREYGPLPCVNVAVFGPHDVASARAVLDWPHWIARKLYAPVAVMVGKFWIGERERDRFGVDIAAPPVSFFSVRHSFPAKDARFLANLPGVAAQLAGAVDDGRDVLMPVLGLPLEASTVRARYADLRVAFPAERKVSA